MQFSRLQHSVFRVLLPVWLVLFLAGNLSAEEEGFYGDEAPETFWEEAQGSEAQTNGNGGDASGEAGVEQAGAQAGQAEAQTALAEGEAPANPAPQTSEPEKEESAYMQSLRLLGSVLKWPFEHVLQPLFGVLVYPVSQPTLYVFQSGAIQRALDMFTFGEEKNIFIYPVFDITPGSETMLGFVYLHSHLLFRNDRLWFTAENYSNGDFYFGTSYQKRKMFDGKTTLKGQLTADLDRNANFLMPGTSNVYSLRDTLVRLDFSVSHPLPFEDWEAGVTLGVKWRNEELPDLTKDILDSQYFDDFKESGIYQDYEVFPLKFSIAYDGTDFRAAPMSGSKFKADFTYNFVSDYRDVPEGYETLLTTEKTHDYMVLELMFQRYFYFGKQKVYHYSMKEARKKRKELLNMTFDSAIQMLGPDSLAGWIGERKVVAVQWRYTRAWEVEEGGMPAISYVRLNNRWPMRGQSNTWASYAVSGISTEYRWPLDYYIDGVVFLEYAIFTDERGDWNLGNIRNSWGFGIRARDPDLYFFRASLGFHGLHGFSFIITFSPEFK